MNKLEKAEQRLEKLRIKAEQAKEKQNNAKALLEAVQSKEIKSLIFYVGTAFVNALERGEIDPDYLINLCSMHGDKRKNFNQLIKSTHGKKPTENPASQ